MKTFRSRVMLCFALLGLLPSARADTGIKIGSLAPALALREILQAPAEVHGT
jgi:hypothetical protein